eukprot:GFUD01032549.1.p1 GENE.GFUD01032549.1~~GFUD01032549.1.p1  ORF type:complete len:489 (-),score=94.05 GFUD01032549.1:103-1569(-)
MKFGIWSLLLSLSLVINSCYQVGGLELGEPLFITDLLEMELHEEVAIRAKVDSILFQKKSMFSGFLTVNYTTGSHLFFMLQVAENNPENAPLVVWLQGGPGWPSTYGAFKEVGAFHVYNKEGQPPKLLLNPERWTQDAHVLFIDSPVGTGFSYTENVEGYPSDDEMVAVHLVEALIQISDLMPHFVPGSTFYLPIFIFGESYGGAYAVALARKIQEYKKFGYLDMDKLDIRGIGIGNGFISPAHQSVYSGFMNSVTFMTNQDILALYKLDRELLINLKKKKYEEAFWISNESLRLIIHKILDRTNVDIVYDYTYTGNYLTSNEYFCFLDQPEVRKALHVGNAKQRLGKISHQKMRGAIMREEKFGWLEEILSNMKVLIYSGNQDIIVNIQGTANMVRALRWPGRDEFGQSKKNTYWVQQKGRRILSGHFNTGGNLTFLVVRGAGHMVPISQPVVARQILNDFISSVHTDFMGSVYKPVEEERRVQCGE